MKSRINEIIQEMEVKWNELKVEYEKLKEKYDYSFNKWKIKFSEKARLAQKKVKNSVFKDIKTYKNFKHIISAPFIYGMIIPFIIMDIGLFIYQNICFRLYNIPLVKRSEYIVFDRQHLKYLNFLDRFNCLYCSYWNGILSYGVEIAGRTEKYWCPIKHAKRTKTLHTWQKHFADYGDSDGFREVFNSDKEFYETKKLKTNSLKKTKKS